MDKLEKHHERILRNISKKVYEKYGEGLVKKINPTADVEFLLKKALERDDLNPEQRQNFEDILLVGVFSKEKEIVDSKVQEKLDKELEKEIEKAVKEGKLPPRALETKETKNDTK